jgi:WD40 repeat protein
MITPINPIPEDLNPEFIDDDLDDRDMPGLHPPTLNAVTAIRGGFAGVRQSVWERTGLGSLPIFNPSVKRPPSEAKVEKQEEPPISSYLSTTESIPQVNYKHLYLSRRIISNRIRGEEVRPMIVDAITSIESGGLSGHTEAIYSLSLFRQPLIFNIGTPKPTYSFLQDSERAGILEVGGRDWLLSGSRDKTLRLWSLDTPKPKVVKVFMGGHEGSVLSTFVVKLASSGNGTSIEKMVAISGGSDGKICKWDIEGDGRPAKEIMAHAGSVLCVKGDQERIVSCSKGQSSSNSISPADNQTGR